MPMRRILSCKLANEDLQQGVLGSKEADYIGATDE